MLYATVSIKEEQNWYLVTSIRVLATSISIYVSPPLNKKTYQPNISVHGHIDKNKNSVQLKIERILQIRT